MYQLFLPYVLKYGLYVAGAIVALYFMAKANSRSLGHLLALGLDLLLAMVIWRQEGITVSSHAYIASKNGKAWGTRLCAVLNKLDPGHAERAVADDIARAKAVITTLTGV